jgi:uncharacterized RDD family membrane protein YckC
LSSLNLNKHPRPLSAPGLARRLAALVYDGLLLLAVFFAATAFILPFNAGRAFTTDQFFYPIYLFTVGFLFFGWFWTHGGQTLGMRAWNLRVLTFDRRNLSWKQALQRYVAALLSWLCLGAGFFWILFDKQHHSWHDYLSRTALFFDPLDE